MKRYIPHKFEENKPLFIGNYNRKVIDTKHSLDQFVNRNIKVISKSIMKRIINDVINEIIENYNDKEGQYGYHSKSTGVGGVVMWRRENDPRNDDGKNHFILKTVLPIKKFHHFNNVEAQIIVEKQVILWAKEKGFTGKKKQNLCESFYEQHEYFEDDFNVTFFEGRLYEFELDGYILIN